MGETAILAAVAVVSVAATATSTYIAVENSNQQAKAARNAAVIEQQQYDEERRAAQLRADQEQAETQRRVSEAINASTALRASRGLDPFSPTGRVLIDATLEEGAADLETIKANAGVADSRLQLGSRASGVRADSSISGARNQSYAAIASGVGQIARTGSGYFSGSGRAA